MPRRGRAAGSRPGSASRTTASSFIGLDYLDQEPAAKAYLAEFGISYPNGPDLQSAAARRYGIKGVPETFFINPAGKITDIVIGPIVSQAKMDAVSGQDPPAVDVPSK